MNKTQHIGRIAIAFTAMAIVCLFVTCAAAEPTKLEKLGVTIDVTELFEKAEKGTISGSWGLPQGSNGGALLVLYFAYPPEELDALATEMEDDDQILREINSRCVTLADIIMTEGDADTFLLQGLNENPEKWEKELIHEEAGRQWYLVLPKDGEFQAEAESDEEKQELEAYTNEMHACRETLIAAARNGEYYTPYTPEEEEQGILRFTTTDMDGNQVTSEELFAGNKITMVNVWGTWCGLCMAELGELADIHRRLQEKGCGIIGVQSELGRITENKIELARELRYANGITYPMVLMPEYNVHLSTVSTFPTSYFVDSEGRILGEPIIGAQVDLYEQMIDELLKTMK